MCKKCHTIENHPDITGEFDGAYLECLREDGHRGPHLFQRQPGAGGEFVLCQSDLCTGEQLKECYGCQSDDPEHWCQLYEEIDPGEARTYIEDKNLINEDWGHPNP